MISCRRGKMEMCIRDRPYTGELALDKVLQLAKILGEYENGMRVYLVPFTKVQTEIHEKCPEGLGTLITRRFMTVSYTHLWRRRPRRGRGRRRP